MQQIKIIYEDKNLIGLNKEAGIVTTREGNDVDTVEDWLLGQFEWPKSLNRGGIIHRLDKGTSGVLLVAKNDKSLTWFKKQFKQRLVYKKYIALVEGDVSYEGEIKVPITRNKYNFLKWAVGVGGKTAWTTFKLIKKYEYEGKKYSLLKIVLKTGRTHQIRVHFAYLGWPLVGDSLYGGKTNFINRPFLHSKKIRLTGLDGEKIEIESDISDDLKMVLKKYEK